MPNDVSKMQTPGDMVDFAQTLADVSRAMTLQAMDGGAGLGMSVKPDRSFVTATDEAIEVHLRDLIAARFPDHGILGEEGPKDGTGAEAEAVWVLDPIDGTAAFIAGIPVFSTLIAWCLRGRPVVGVMDFPALGLRYVGVRGRATTLNGAPLGCSAKTELSTAFMSASNPDLFAPDEAPVLEALRTETAWRVWGSAALAYGRLAEGRIDLSLDAGFKIWDVAAMVPVVEGAGGTITDWQGQPITLDTGTQVLAAGNAALHAAALKRVRAAGAATRPSMTQGAGE